MFRPYRNFDFFQNDLGIRVGPYWPRTRGVISFHRFLIETNDKIFSETARPKACIFGMQQCHVELYINPIMPLGLNMAPHPGSL